MIEKKSPTGLINGKCHLILIIRSKLKKLYFLEKEWKTVIHRAFNKSEAFRYSLNEKLDFNAHIKEKISKAYRGIGMIKKLQSKLSGNALLTIYKSLIRPHLDYGDIVSTNLLMTLFVKNWKAFSTMLQ